MYSADFSAINAKLKSKDIRQLGLKQVSLENLDSDSDDDDFEENSAANEQSEDLDYHGDGENDQMSETSDTDEVLRELDSESDDDGMKIEHDDDENNPPVSVLKYKWINV